MLSAKNLSNGLVISCSLKEDSRSRRLALAAVAELEKAEAAVQFIDLRDYKLPLCDGEGTYDDPAANELSSFIAEASLVLIAAPVYNYDLNAAAKNLVELTGSSWKGKIVGFLCAAGGRSSYMSPIGLANSLMLDFRCWIVPRFVYAIGEDFREADELSDEIQLRIEQLCGDALKLAAALKDKT